VSKNCPEELCQLWVHSHEEDTNAEVVFRPESYEFPPSRGRFSFELKEDGNLVRFGIGPTDKATPTGGSWKLEGNKLSLNPDMEGAPAQVFEVVKSDPGILVVRK
jgi:hypothetical protein